MTIKWATKLRKGTRKNDRNKFAEKGRIFLLKRMKGTKKKQVRNIYIPKIFPNSHSISMLICGKPVQLLKFCIASVGVKLSLP